MNVILSFSIPAKFNSRCCNNHEPVKKNVTIKKKMNDSDLGPRWIHISKEWTGEIYI